MNKIQSFLELPFSFDLQRLNADLDLVKDDEWVDHPNTRAYEGIWQSTSLTSISGETRDIVALEDTHYKQTPLLQRSSYIKSVMDSFKTKVEAVRFMKLGSKSNIKEHCDKGSSFEEGLARVHIPIRSSDEVEFILSGKNYKMDLGKCYYIDAHNPHAVVNDGDIDRVHLLIDCQVNDWLKDIFIKGGFEESVFKYGEKSITDDNVDEMILSLKAIGTDISIEMANKLENIKNGN